MKVISQAPTRIGLIGGGTDVNPFAYDYGGQILSLAINLIHTTILIPRKDKKIIISALNHKKEFKLGQQLTYGIDKDFDLIRAIINHFSKNIKTGFDLKIKFSGISTSGLGTSASVAVSIIGAFNTWLNLKMSKFDILLLAWKLENNELNWITGKQDQLAAVFGGINMFYFGLGDRVIVEPLTLSINQIESLKKWTLLIFLHSTRNSGSIQKTLTREMNYFVKQKALFALKDSVNEAYESIKNQDYFKLGHILDEVWLNKKTSNPAATNPFIDKIYSLGIKNGALGGKVMGAGGGGHMFLFAPPEKHSQIKKALQNEKIDFINFNYDFEGLTVKIEN